MEDDATAKVERILDDVLTIISDRFPEIVLTWHEWQDFRSIFEMRILAELM